MSDRYFIRRLRGPYIPTAERDKLRQNKSTRTVAKRVINDQLQQRYPSFVIPTSMYEIIFLNKYTSIDIMIKLINHVQQCTQFTIDTESENSNGQLALIQIQTIPPQLPSLIILIELAHLPSTNRTKYVKIKEFLQLVFRSNNELYSWGQLNDELRLARDYHLFEWPILASTIDIQYFYPGWYEWALSHCETCCPSHHAAVNDDITLNFQNYPLPMCVCHEQSPYRPHEKWSLQKALIYAAQVFIDKSCTVNNWSAGSTSNSSTLSTARREKMINYAIYDCFATTYLIRPVLDNWTFKKLKDTNIIELFTAFKLPALPTYSSINRKINKKMEQNVNSQTLNIIDEDLEIISDDDEIYLDQLIEPVNNKQSNYEDISSDEHELNTQLPANDVDLPHDTDVEVEPTTDHKALDVSNVYDVTVTIRNDYVQEIVSDFNYQSNEDLNVPNYDLLVDNHAVVDEDNNIIQSLPIQRRSCHQRRTARSRRRRNRKRNNSLRAQRYRYYMTRHIYHRFHMPLIKIILRQHDIIFMQKS